MNPNKLDTNNNLTIFSENLFLYNKLHPIENQCTDANKGDELLKSIFRNFKEIVLLAPMVKNMLSSRDFSIMVRECEKMLLTSEQIVKKCSLENNNEFNEMKEDFEILFQMIPLGDSVLLQRDLDNIKKLTMLPKNKTYQSKWGEFYESFATTHDVTCFFQDFCYQNNYLSICVISNLDTYYKFCVKTIMTVVAFRKKNKKPSKIWNLVSKVFPYKDDKQKQFNELKLLVESQYQKWGFKRFEIIHVEDMSHCKFENHQIEIDEWGWYVLLYHREVESNESLSLNNNNTDHECHI